MDKILETISYGDIIEFTGDTLPDGYVYTSGSLIEVDKYPQLKNIVPYKNEKEIFDFSLPDYAGYKDNGFYFQKISVTDNFLDPLKSINLISDFTNLKISAVQYLGLMRLNYNFNISKPNLLFNEIKETFFFVADEEWELNFNCNSTNDDFFKKFILPFPVFYYYGREYNYYSSGSYGVTTYYKDEMCNRFIESQNIFDITIKEKDSIIPSRNINLYKPNEMGLLTNKVYGIYFISENRKTDFKPLYNYSSYINESFKDEDLTFQLVGLSIFSDMVNGNEFYVDKKTYFHEWVVEVGYYDHDDNFIVLEKVKRTDFIEKDPLDDKLYLYKLKHKTPINTRIVGIRFNEDDQIVKITPDEGEPYQTHFTNTIVGYKQSFNIISVGGFKFHFMRYDHDEHKSNFFQLPTETDTNGNYKIMYVGEPVIHKEEP